MDYAAATTNGAKLLSSNVKVAVSRASLRNLT